MIFVYGKYIYVIHKLIFVIGKLLKIVWDDARVFLAIARAGTLTGASALLGTGVATISRRIERFERALGLPLFIRHQTGYRLTDEGDTLLSKAEELESAVLAFQSDASLETEVAGVVRLATAENFANLLIIPSLQNLLSSYPALRLECVTDVAVANLHRRDADLAVRMVKPSHGNVSMRRIGSLGYGLYGSRSYLSASNERDAEASFEQDQFIGWTENYRSLPAAQWIEKRLQGRPAAIATTSLASQISAACSGLGLAVLPHFVADRAGLQPLDVEVGIEEPIWLVIHTDLAHSQRVRTVADYVTEVFEQNRNWLKRGAKESTDKR